MFSYVPFNEPDNIWYNKTDKKQALFDDWLAVYQKIKSLDPTARIVGPNCFQYDRTLFRDFLVFAKNNNCLPDVISWHELDDEFFADWYNHYDDYRSIESSLGIPAREICINEYCRKEGDLGVPGKLVQWMARFENSKVDACLAYWTSAGCLSNLMARDNYNQATGGWWLYKWYGSMTGHTVKVTPPKANAEGLQGIASCDSEKQQVRILFGGSDGSTDIVVTGCDSAPYFGSKAHVSIWATASTGHTPSNGPVLVMQGHYAINKGQIIVTVNDMVETTAYQLIMFPGGDAIASANYANRYEAKYADLVGSANVIYRGNSSRPETDCVGGYAKTNYAGTNFVVTANAVK